MAKAFATACGQASDTNVVTAKEMFHCQLLVWSQLAVSEGFGGITYCLADSNFGVSHGSVSQVKQHAYLKKAKSDRRQQQSRNAASLYPQLPQDLQRAVDAAKERGASNWLTTLSIDEHGFALHKGAFRDALCLRYGWRPSRLATECVCGKNFTVDHALSCPRGGFPALRHNEIRDLTAQLLSETCPCVSTEPELQPLSGETLTYSTSNTQDGARLDVRAEGFWGDRRQSAFFDVRVFNPLAPSNRCLTPASCYRKHEREKRRAYRIAGNFRGVLIFVIFVTIPRVTKFSTHEFFHPRIFSRLLTSFAYRASGSHEI